MTAKHILPAPEGARTSAQPSRADAPQGRPVRRFWRDDVGAITVDWIAITVGITVMIAGLFNIVGPKIMGWLNAITIG